MPFRRPQDMSCLLCGKFGHYSSECPLHRGKVIVYRAWSDTLFKGTYQGITSREQVALSPGDHASFGNNKICSKVCSVTRSPAQAYYWAVRTSTNCPGEDSRVRIRNAETLGGLECCGVVALDLDVCDTHCDMSNHLQAYKYTSCARAAKLASESKEVQITRNTPDAAALAVWTMADIVKRSPDDVIISQKKLHDYCRNIMGPPPAWVPL